MAGSVATLAILWVSLQTMGLLGHSHSIGTYNKLPESLQNYLVSYTGKHLLRTDLWSSINFSRRKTWKVEDNRVSDLVNASVN